MRVLARGGIVLLLISVAMMTSCREQGKGTGNSSTGAIPEHFELDFDNVFDLKKPCTLTPALLEAKLDSLAVVPREKLYRLVQISNQPAHWISVQSSPVHNPVYSIFKGSFQPTSTTVIWQGQSLEHFFCTMPAEEDQEVPLKLVDDIGTSLGTGHTFNALLKQYEWTLDHYSVSAKYSTNVGKRVPVFLVTVRNKQVQQPVAQSRGPSKGTWVPKSEISAAPSSLRPHAPYESVVSTTPLNLPAQPRSVAASTPSSGSTTTAPIPAADSSRAFKLRLAQTNGLLISQLSSGEESGQVTKMTLTAVFNLMQSPSVLQFNQDVGSDMRQSLNEVLKLALIRHTDLPAGHTLEIGFEDKYVDKDGPSAAVACALLVESAVTGQTWDPLFAVTGDLNADGSVQPIGGVRAKIRGATKGSCKLVAVPAKNEKAVADTLLLDGPVPLVGITVFGIKTFDDALRLARPDRPEALTRALADFDAMRTVIQRDPRQAAMLLRTPHAIQRLQALYAVAPECYSAKYLLGYAQGRVARTLSLGGSIEAAQNSAQAILYAIKNDAATAVNKLKPDEVGNALSKLRSLRPSMDQRVWPFVDGVADLGEVLRGAILNPVRSGARFQDILRKVEKSAAAAESAMSFLMNTAEVREELGL